MKYISLAASILVLFALQTGLTSCNSSPSTTTLPGAWDQMSDFAGYPRTGASSFVINGVPYVGCGYNFDLAGQTGQSGRLNDFWKYDANQDTWIRVAPFPGAPRSGAVAFSLNGKGYVGTGIDGNSNPLRDFYEFDPTAGPTGTWKRIADFCTTATGIDTTTSSPKRYGALAFTVKNRAFVGGGYYVGALIDFWEYDQANNVWIQRPNMGGSKRQNGFVMVINDIAYVGGGSENGQIVKNFWKFDVTQLDGGKPWTALNGLTGKDANGNAISQPRPKELASTFTIGNYGYLVTGSLSAGVIGGSSDCWQYDPSTDVWTQYYSFSSNSPVAGAARGSAIGFAVGDYGFITTGGSGTSQKFDDCWRFDPNGKEPDNK